MKKTFQMILGVLMIANFISCEDDGEITLQETSIQFGEDKLIAENSDVNDILLVFNRPANKDGSIKIKVTTTNPESFQTNPAVSNGFLEIPVWKGDPGVSFKFTPANDEVLNQIRTIKFDLEATTNGYSFGSKKDLTITLFDDESPVPVNFQTVSSNLREDNTSGVDVILSLPVPSPETGKIVIQYDGEMNEELFTTVPSFTQEGKLELVIPSGATSATFKLIPSDNDLLKGHRILGFTISDTEGAIIKGTYLNYALTILDDELISKPKGYETLAGSWGSKKIREYDETGRVSKILWETRTPGVKSGADTYYYSQSGVIEKINHYPNHDEYFYWENGKLVYSEEIKNSIKTSYTEYDYDFAGNIGGKAIYHRQSNGEYIQSLVFVYLYFEDGNLYKQQTYIPVEGDEEFSLISTRTYEHYLDKVNPFPTEVVPTVLAQSKLPTSYRQEEGDVNIVYTFDYEFGEDGLPTKRIATSSSVSETTSYLYY